MSLPTLAAGLAAILLATDPFALFAPAVRLGAADRAALERGETVVRTLESADNQVAVFAAARINSDPVALIAHARDIESLKRSSFVAAIHRFSDPPQLSDLDELVLSPRDLDAIAACRVGACSFKLTAAEIAMLDAATGVDRQTAFRRVVLARTQSYLAGGLKALPLVVNRRAPLCLARVLEEIVSASGAMAQSPCIRDWLHEVPAARQRVESFLYWSVEHYGSGKPVVIVTDVGLIAPASPDEPAIVLGKQVFASRYMTGAVAVTAIVTDPSTGSRYLIYVNRTAVDLLGGMFGSFKRSILESQLRHRVPEIIAKLRTRLERGAVVTVK